VRAFLVPSLVSYAVGTLLGVALLALLPEALAQLRSATVLGTLLAGILTFFVLEKLVLWRHCHSEECEVHGRPASLVLIGHAFHSFVDGALIGAAVQTSVPLGISTATAVAMHEIPQQLGDFAILLHGGFTRAAALGLSVLSAASAILGTLFTFGALGRAPAMLPYALAFAAASFLYIAMADLMPDLHRGHIDAGAVRQVLLVGAGIATAMAL
jgi:zinc and cadmium transporter